jgi:hypothetical protein
VAPGQRVNNAQGIDGLIAALAARNKSNGKG